MIVIHVQGHRMAAELWSENYSGRASSILFLNKYILTMTRFPSVFLCDRDSEIIKQLVFNLRNRSCENYDQEFIRENRRPKLNGNANSQRCYGNIVSYRVAMFTEGRQIKKYCFIAMFPDRGVGNIERSGGHRLPGAFVDNKKGT